MSHRIILQQVAPAPAATNQSEECTLCAKLKLPRVIQKTYSRFSSPISLTKLGIITQFSNMLLDPVEYTIKSTRDVTICCNSCERLHCNLEERKSCSAVDIHGGSLDPKRGGI